MFLTKKNERLRVYCFKDTGGDFGSIKASMQSALLRAFELAKKTGHSPPLILLANEMTLKYKYDIDGKEVISIVNDMQKLLPDDIWVAVAFNVLQTADGLASNMGYFFTRNEWICQEKRSLTKSDTDALYTFNPPKRTEIAVNWRKLGEGRANEGKSYLIFETPTGIPIEYRICRDVVEPPIVKRLDMFTLVSAGEIGDDQMHNLSRARMGIIANDFTRREPIVLLRKSFCPWGVPLVYTETI